MKFATVLGATSSKSSSVISPTFVEIVTTGFGSAISILLEFVPAGFQPARYTNYFCASGFFSSVFGVSVLGVSAFGVSVFTASGFFSVETTGGGVVAAGALGVILKSDFFTSIFRGGGGAFGPLELPKVSPGGIPFLPADMSSGCW